MIKYDCRKFGNRSTAKQSLGNLPKVLLKGAIQKTYKKNSMIYDQGDEIKYVAMVQSGKAIAASFDVHGKECWINSYVRNQFIGMEALFEACESSFRVVAKTDVQIFFFPKKLILSAMQEDMNLSKHIMTDLICQVRHFANATVKVQSLSKRGLIASEFKRLAQPSPQQSDAYVISPAPVFTEVALRLGVARETVSRTVSDLVKMDVLKRERSNFIVPDISRLEAQMV